MARRPVLDGGAGARSAVTDWTPVTAILEDARANKVFPGGVLEVGGRTGRRWRGAAGSLTYADEAPAVTHETVFDLASLTKVLATTAVAMHLGETKRLDLDAPVSAWVPEWSTPDRQQVTIRDLCLHTSGLPGWLPLYRTCRGRQAFVSAICATPLSYAPRSSSVYSDLGFILLGHLLESASGTNLDAAAGEIWSSIGSEVSAGLSFRPPASWLPRVAPTSTDDERGTLAPGEVDDTNAWALGGVAGHAGMFGTAGAVGAFAQAISRTLAGETPAEGVTRDTLRQFVTRGAIPGSSRALGWDTMLPSSSCGTRMTSLAFGHTGFTGTSLWIDPGADVYIVILTNRVHPRAVSHEPIQSVRRALHDAVMQAVRP